MSEIVVGDALHFTAAWPVSLSVITFHSVPPHCGPGAATRRLSSGRESEGGGECGKRRRGYKDESHSRTSEGSIDEPQVLAHYRPSAGRT